MIRIPNFFKYAIIIDNRKMGTICAPCRKVAQITWETSGIPLLYPNAKIKFIGLNLGKKS